MKNVFVEAKRLIEEKGWYQGASHGPDGSLCATGALDRICIDAVFMMRVDEIRGIADRIAAEQYPDRIVGRYPYPIINVNDHPDTTQEDIFRIFEKAAIEWDEVQE